MYSDVVGEVGLEPTRALSSQDFESGVSTIPPLALIVPLNVTSLGEYQG